jgi:AcrR family transcriptional regulator
MPRPTELIRPWRGVSPELRVADRRERLVQAGLEVFTSRTFHGAKVRDVCQEAGLTERYFYESFTGKQELLMALADTIVEDFVTAALPSIALVTTDVDAAIEGAMAAVVHSLTDDPRRARILFVESVGVSPAAEAKRRSVIGKLAAVIQGAAAPAFGDWVNASVEVELIARSLIGAASELIIAHVRHELPLDQQQLITNMTRLFMRARSVLLAVAAERTEHTEHTEHTEQRTRRSHA